MASGKSLELREIPRRTREWVHQHKVRNRGGRAQAANRAELRQVRSPLISRNKPYVKKEQTDA